MKSSGVVGVVGGGFVGTALREGLKHAFRVEVFDRDPERRTVGTLAELVHAVDELVFVSVPTPMRPSGECDLSIVEQVVRDLAAAARPFQPAVLTVVIKSTVPPGTTRRLQEQHPGLNLVFNPEFLTEASFVEDFKHQDRIILGGDDVSAAAEVYQIAYPTVLQYRTDATTAEAVKYVANSFLALKVTFANEWFELASRLNISFGELTTLARLDRRLGDSHWQVPGPDGSRGFGGSCFPKDISAITYLADLLGVPLRTLETARDENQERFRPGRDWTALRGRAVSD